MSTEEAPTTNQPLPQTSTNWSHHNASTEVIARILLATISPEDAPTVTHTQPSPSSSSHPSVPPSAIYFTLIGVLGVLGNGLVVLLILHSHKMRGRVHNWFIVNLSAADFSASVLLIASENSKRVDYGYSGLGRDVFCRVWLSDFFLWSLFLVSTFSLLSLSLERHLAIVYPLWHRKWIGPVSAGVLLGCAWAAGPLYNLFNLTATRVSPRGTCLILRAWPSEAFRRIFGIVTTVVQFVLPLAAMVYGYSRMIMAVKQQSLATAHQQSAAQAMRMRAERNLTKALVLVCCGFTLCWGWNQIYFLLGNLDALQIDYRGSFYKFSVAAAYTNCCINPFLYAFKYKDFQNEVRRVFCRSVAVAPFVLSGTESGQPTNQP